MKILIINDISHTLIDDKQNNQTSFICVYFGVSGNQQLVDLLIRNGVNVNLPDNQGRKPLHYAAFLGIAT